MSETIIINKNADAKIVSQGIIVPVFDKLKGKSAYEVAVENGFVGTVEQWLKSLKGEIGFTGPRGVQGIQGEQGLQGFPGPQGERGLMGTPGVPGIKGDRGLQGVPGISAYQSAISGGYSGTEARFNNDIASMGDIGAVLDAINQIEI